MQEMEAQKVSMEKNFVEKKYCHLKSF